MGQRDDRQLIARAKANPEEFTTLYEKYAERIHAYFWYRIGHQSELADDLTQETFLRAFRRLSQFQWSGHPYVAYLYKIAHSILCNYYRKMPALPLEAAKEKSYEIGEELLIRAEAVALWQEISHLLPHEREALMLRYREDLPIKDVAKTVGKTENAVKLTLSRARKKLSALLNA